MNSTILRMFLEIISRKTFTLCPTGDFLLRFTCIHYRKKIKVHITKTIEKPENVSNALMARTYGLRIEYCELLRIYFQDNNICPIQRFGLPLNDFCQGFVYKDYEKYLVKKCS